MARSIVSTAVAPIRAAFLAALLAWQPSAHAWQGVPAAVLVPATPVTPATPAAPAAGPVAAPGPDAARPEGAAADAESKAQERIAKLSALSFDRQPAVVLLGVPAERVDEVLNAASAARRGPTPATAEAPSPAAAQDPAAAEFDRQLATLRADVAAGRWDDVGTFLRGLAAAEAKAGYDRILEQFATLPPAEPGHSGRPVDPPLPAIALADVTGLVRAAPLPLADDDGKRLEALGQIAAHVLATGVEGADLASALEPLAGTPGLARHQAATIIAAAGRADLVGPFLPSLDECLAARDADGVDLWVRSLEVARSRDPRAVPLDTLWQAVRRSLEADGLDDGDRRRAVGRAAALLPRLSRSVAREWIGGVAASRPAAAADLLAYVAARVATGPVRAAQEVDERRQWLELQREVVAGMLGVAAPADARLDDLLALAARGWAAEARLSAELDEPDTGFRRDPYGNVFYWEMHEIDQRRQQMPQWPVKLADVLDTRPSDAWRARLGPTERPAIDKALAVTLSKAGRAEEALAVVEGLAADHRDAARRLVPQVLDGWKLAHDPDDERRRQMPFFWYFGMDEAKTGIPLSRSMQERNLTELEALVGRLRALDLGPLDDLKLVSCFTSCHSAAEVYAPEAIRRVFGPPEALAPRAAAGLAATMRGNLAGAWRRPSVQEQAKTKRREADIQREVLAGYETARTFVAAARARGDHWALATVAAALAHDENDFRRKLADTPEFTPRRREALDGFAAAAAAYAAATATLPRDEWTIGPFETWLLAASGACDPDRIDETTQAVAGEPERIRAVVDTLPAEQRDWHRERLATGIVGRLGKLNPAVKYRVTAAGLAIAGDHPRAREAKQVVEYYGDLVREIELRADIDGPDRVGHGRPFGVLVALRHTREIEREAGGFGRYLQNQKAGGMAYFNYGRPLQDYRDAFERTVRTALGDSFDVRSVTFESDKVQSRSDTEYGWRRTPYAYLVLSAKDPKIDRLPPLRLDLDFLDSSGYVVLPIESRPTLLDARDAAPPPRPWENLTVTQILDERRAAEGKLGLEIRATARGLVPDLETILDPAVPGFTVAGVTDSLPGVSRFEADAPTPAVVSERTWSVTLERSADGATSFTFPVPRVETAEHVRQRYADADLVAAAETIDLRGPVVRAGSSLTRWLVPGAVAAAVLAGLALALRAWKNRPRVVPRGFTVPDPATPFAVIQLLRDIEAHDGLDRRARGELAESIARIEREFFAGDGADTDLVALARSWAGRARRR